MTPSQQLYQEQLEEWSDFRNRVEQLSLISWRKFDMGTYSILAQYNPARAVSSGAKLDKESIAARKCFLCKENRPEIQKGISLDSRFTLLVNPFPILKGHFTIPYNQHHNQEIKPFIADFLKFAKALPECTLFYNGPQCGASAPDHLHFQAIERGQLPLETEWNEIQTKILSDCKQDRMEELLHFGRKCIHITASKEENAISFFLQIYAQYQLIDNTKSEPKMNLFAFFENNQWQIFIFPRKTHRPSQFYEKGEKFKMISPGAIDIAGILVLPRKEDFESITKEEIENVLNQVSY